MPDSTRGSNGQSLGPRRPSDPNPALPLPGHESPLSLGFHICKVGYRIPASGVYCGYFRSWTAPSTVLALGYRWQKLDWTDSLAQDSEPAIIQD